MKHIDALKLYQDLVKSGLPIGQAEAHVEAMDSVFRDIADQFVSQKYTSIFTGIIVAIGLAMGGLMFSMKTDLKDMDRRLTSIENYIYLTKR